MTREEKKQKKKAMLEKRNGQIIAFLRQRLDDGWRISESIEVAADKFCLSTQTIWNIRREMC